MIKTVKTNSQQLCEMRLATIYWVFTVDQVSRQTLNHQGTLTYDYDYDLTSLPMWWVVKTLNKVFIMVVAENLLMFWVTGLNIQESRGI